MQIKSHESPRRRGRNSKGKNASARLRQLKKRTNRNIDILKPYTNQNKLNS